MTLRISVGCEKGPTLDWKNFENSLGLRVSEVPVLPRLLHAFGIIGTPDSTRENKRNEGC